MQSDVVEDIISHQANRVATQEVGRNRNGPDDIGAVLDTHEAPGFKPGLGRRTLLAELAV